MSDKLSEKKIAILATDGVEQIELTRPRDELNNAGVTTELVSIKDGDIQGMNHDEKADIFLVDKTIHDVSASDYDALIIPGGVHNPDTMRMNEDAVSFVREFFKQKKPVSAICHGPWLLVEADVLDGRKVTSWPSLKTDIINAGGEWFDKEVVVDQGLTTSRNPEDLDAFCSKTIEEILEGKHDKQAA